MDCGSAVAGLQSVSALAGCAAQRHARAGGRRSRTQGFRSSNGLRLASRLRTRRQSSRQRHAGSSLSSTPVSASAVTDLQQLFSSVTSSTPQLGSKLRPIVEGNSPQASWKSAIETQLSQLEGNAEVAGSKLRSFFEGSAPQADWKSTIETQLHQLESNAEVAGSKLRSFLEGTSPQVRNQLESNAEVAGSKLRSFLEGSSTQADWKTIVETQLNQLERNAAVAGSKLRSYLEGTTPQADWQSAIGSQLHQLESNVEVTKLQEQLLQAQHGLVDAVRGIVQGVTQQQDGASGMSFDAQSAFELLQSRLQAASSAVQNLSSQLGSNQNAYDLLQDRLHAASTAVQDLLTQVGSNQVEWSSVIGGLGRVLCGAVGQALSLVGNASLATALFVLQSCLGAAAAGVQDWAQHLDGVQTTAAVVLLFTLTTASLLLAMDNARKVPALDDLPLRYNSEQIAAYFSRRRPLVFARLVQVAFKSSKFAVSLALDYARGKLEKNEAIRARQLRELITSLGAAAIKVGQGLSIRPDILSVAYLAELQLLQDRVPAFNTPQALQILEQSLQRPPSVVFSYISPEPVAAASLGQVYKAVLRDTGETVAVKVQRPDVLESVALDLYIIRNLFSWIQRIPRVKSNLVEVMESWAFRFFDELDYVQEAENAMLFAEQMRILENITVPRVYPQYTTRKVLTTAWIDGEKLSESNASDVAPLVTTMLNCYLIQLLETGFLHADPHPGNLLRTQDGKLCVLDFGLMTEVTEDQRYTLVEYIAHLLNSDFDKVPYDLMRLGFIPNDKISPEEAAEVAPILGAVIGQFMRGGGAASIDVDAITRDLSALSDTYTFVIPPWFALILRAFGTLEGLGLRADPTYSITKECYPYLSKRLLTDDNPRIRAALRYFLYKGQERLDVNRVKELATNFQRFAEASKTLAPTNSTLRTTGPVIDQWSQQALQLLFAREGSYLQDLLLQEAVRATDALSRGALAQSWQIFGNLAAQSPLAIQLLAPRTQPEPNTWPILLPGVVAGKVPYAQLTEEDQEALRTVQGLWEILEPELQKPRPNPISGWDARTLSQQVFPLVAGLVPGAGLLGLRFLRLLLERQALRLADDLDRGLQTQELPDTTSPASRRRVTP